MPIDKPSSLPATVVSATAAPKLVLPDGIEIPVNAAAKSIGRIDFDKVLSREDLKYISRQHLVIKAEDDKYYIEDLNSTNGTKTNGLDIKGKSRQELKDGDRIRVADVVELTFKE
jgi:pSer/pThr/pTyr-binding forkhead associated (FHA) protein